MTKKKILLSLFVLITSVLLSFHAKQEADSAEIISYTIDVTKQDLTFYWKDEHGTMFNSIQNLKEYLNTKKITLLFAMNGGMYKQDHSPQGLFIQKQQTLTPLDTSSGGGNFYLKPNGVFYITTGNKAVICETAAFIDNGKIQYATQSGPMLLINGAIHSAFKEGSANLNIRNGVGILPDNKVVFALSKQQINFYDFANYFKRLGCKQALYLDGFVSRMYLPEKNWVQTDGDFGVIIAVTEHK